MLTREGRFELINFTLSVLKFRNRLGTFGSKIKINLSPQRGPIPDCENQKILQKSAE